MQFHIIQNNIITDEFSLFYCSMSRTINYSPPHGCPTSRSTTLHHMAALLLDRVFSCDIQALYNVKILISAIQGNYTKRDIHTREICDVSQHTLEYT